MAYMMDWNAMSMQLILLCEIFKISKQVSNVTTNITTKCNIFTASRLEKCHDM